MEGEPKKEMYDLLPKSLYPATCNVLPNEDFSLLLTIDTISNHLSFHR